MRHAIGTLFLLLLIPPSAAQDLSVLWPDPEAPNAALLLQPDLPKAQFCPDPFPFPFPVCHQGVQFGDGLGKGFGDGIWSPG